MATYVAKQLIYAGRLVQPGETFEIELTEGQKPPPLEVAVPEEESESPTKNKGGRPKKEE